MYQLLASAFRRRLPLSSNCLPEIASTNDAFPLPCLEQICCMGEMTSRCSWGHKRVDGVSRGSMFKLWRPALTAHNSPQGPGELATSPTHKHLKPFEEGQDRKITDLVFFLVSSKCPAQYHQLESHPAFWVLPPRPREATVCHMTGSSLGGLTFKGATHSFHVISGSSVRLYRLCEVLTGLRQGGVMTAAEVLHWRRKHPMVAMNVWHCEVTTNLTVQGKFTSAPVKY